MALMPVKTLTVTSLVVDGTTLPTPALEGVTMSENKMWSANAGRLEQTGSMAGTIVGIKRKAEIKWPPLSMAQAEIIKNVVSSMTPFHTVEMVDLTGSRISMTVYFGDISYKIVSYSPGYQRVEDVSVSMVEQ